MRKSLQAELIRTFKSDAAEIVKQNPYILTDFSGIGFSLADRVALNIGYARDSIERKKAVVIHCLKQNMQEGSVWISGKLLINNIQVLIQVPGLGDGVEVLVDEGVIVADSDSYDDMYYAFVQVAIDELFIADVLINMAL
jgi:exodeoxyribonuclease V alpha subunit